MAEHYEKFYEQYRDKLFSYLFARSRDYDVARDIMQESFTRHFQHYGNAAVISPALLFTIARNALIDHYRHQDKYKISENAVPPTSEAVEERSLETKEKAAEIHAALEKLSAVDREILTLAVAGAQYKDIAETLELTEVNVKVRVHRARVKLREILKKEVR